MCLHPELVVLDMGAPVHEVVVACVALRCNVTELAAISCLNFGFTELVLDVLGWLGVATSAMSRMGVASFKGIESGDAT